MPDVISRSLRAVRTWKAAIGAAERKLASELFLGSHAEAAPAPPPGADRLGVVRFLISTDAFARAVAEPASGRARPVTARMREWAGRLPLSDASVAALGQVRDRQALLAILFSDQTFLTEVVAGRPLGFSPGRLLAAVEVDAADVRFVADLLERGSPLIDKTWLAQWGLERTTDAASLVCYGGLSWFSASPLFDADGYGRTHGVGGGWFTRLRAYVETGAEAGQAPNPFLNPSALLSANRDLAGSAQARGVPWLELLAEREASERRSATNHFDTDHYVGQVPAEAWRPYGSAFAHYVAVGWREGLRPNPCFDELWYLRTYPEALRAVRSGDFPNGFSHFVQRGEALGLKPSPFFDAEGYAERNADLKAAAEKGLNLFRHFWSQGRFEGREQGDRASEVVTRVFVRRLPLMSDRVVADGLEAAPSDPKSVLAAARGPARPNLVDLIVQGRAAEAPAAFATALNRLARPSVRIEHGAAQQIHAGDVNRFYVSGYAAFAGLPLKAVHAWSPRVRGSCEHFTHVSLEGVDVAAQLGVGGEGLRTGFMAWFAFSTRDLNPGEERVRLEFVFQAPSGEEARAEAWVSVKVHPRPMRSESDAPVQVAMASYNPPAEPFRRQVDSILANPGVHLVISDDASPAGAESLAQVRGDDRVDIDVNAANTGFIINFERSLYMCSDKAQTVLFSDQDDLWRDDKVQTLVSALKAEDAVCAFSDMRITDAEGEVISPTFWSGRTLHHFDPLTLGVANTVTGAAAAFPAELTRMLTPFPRYTSGLYHDQWLSVLASAVGHVAYVERPLYDYIQHGGNVLGFAGSRLRDTAKWPYVLRRLRRVRRTGRADECDVEHAVVAVSQMVGVLQRFVMWREALVRAPKWRDPSHRRLAEQACAAISGAPFDAGALKRGFSRLSRPAGGEDGLLAIDALIECVVLSQQLIESGVIGADRVAAHMETRRQAQRGHHRRSQDQTRSDFDRKIEPLQAHSVAAPSDLRINLFLPELTLRHFFGGYHSKASLITRLRERGVRTRLILVDEPRVDADAVAEIIGAFPELEKGLSESEIVAVGLRDRPLDIGPGDVLMATTWWSAHLVEGLRKQLGRDRFLYFIQEYEPFTFSLGTWYRAAEQTYDFPHDAVFSTEVLEGFFRDQKAGVFAPTGGGASLPFRNPITGLRDVPRRPLDASRRPRLLFYARPQATEARNMYDFGLAALRQAAREMGSELDGWDLVGVGADRTVSVDLGEGHALRLIKKLDSHSYREMLASSDVGLSLMYTPHPSLVPLEMAAAGMITVTNACMSKTAQSLAGVSPLLRVAEPDVEAIAAELVRAFRQVKAGEAAMAPVDWPVSPAEAFTDEWLDQFSTIATGAL